jgi:6-phosphogluconolactonase
MCLNGRIALLAGILLVIVISTGCGYQYHCTDLSGNGPSCYSNGSTSGSGGSGSGGTGGSGGSGGGVGGGPQADYFYYLGTGGYTVQAAGLSSAGAFSAMANFTAPSLPTGGAADMLIADEQYLYIPYTASSGGGEILAYTIDKSSGALSAVTGQPFSTGTPKCDAIASDPSNRFLYCSDSSTGDVAAFTIASGTGVLTTVPASPFTIYGAIPNNMAVDSSGLYLYVAPGIYAFNIDQNTGALSPVVGSPFGTLSSGRLQAIPGTSYMVGMGNTVAVAGGDAHLYLMPIEAGTGALLSETPYPTVNAPYQMAVHPTGGFIYTFALVTGGIAPVEGYAFNSSTGALSAMSNSPFTSLPTLEQGKIDQTGTELFAPSGGGQYVVLTVDPTTGALTQSTTPLNVPSATVFAVTN